MAKGQKVVSIVKCALAYMCVCVCARARAERIIGNLMDSANGFHTPKPDLDVEQENNNSRNNNKSVLRVVKIPKNSLGLLRTCIIHAKPDRNYFLENRKIIKNTYIYYQTFRMNTKSCKINN